MTNSLRTIVSGLVVFLLAQLCPGLVIVDNQQPKATIVLPDNPTDRERIAAEDFQLHVLRMSGGKLPIVGQADRPGGLCIDIGATHRGRPVRQALARRADLNDEAVMIDVSDDRVVLIGRTDDATSHAVYILLEQLGVRWILPTQQGAFVPQRVTVTLANQKTIAQPAFTMRQGLPLSNHRDLVGSDAAKVWYSGVHAWSRRNRFGGLQWVGGGHSYNALVPPRKYFDAHPEYFALRDGERKTTQLCTTNAQVIRIATRTARGWARKFPGRLIGVGPNDGDLFCECDPCRKMVYKPGNQYDRIVTFANHIASEVSREFPEARFIFYADYHSEGAPTRVQPHQNLVFWVVKWSTDRAHGINHPNVKRFKNAIANWSKYGNKVILYTYYGHYNVFTYWPIVNVLKEDFPYFQDHGVTGVYSETHQHWGCQGLVYYVYGRLAWNPNADVDAIVDEYCHLAFGPAAKTMRQYYDLLEQTMDGASSVYGKRREVAAIFTPQVIARADTLMRMAEKQVAQYVAEHPDPDLQWRMNFVAKGQRLAKAYLSGHHAMMRYEQTRNKALLKKVEAAWTEAIDLMTDPDNPGIAEHSAIREVTQELATLEDKLVYGPGEFHYSDGLDNGGKAILHSSSYKGFRAGTWGLDLPAKQSGEVSWRFTAADDCVFDTVSLRAINFSYRQMDRLKHKPDDVQRYQANSNDLEVRSPLTQGKYVPLAKNENLLNAKFDITKHIKGTGWFEVRFRAYNSSMQNILSVDNFMVSGTVTHVDE
jgi:hypothetical protein